MMELPESHHRQLQHSHTPHIEPNIIVPYITLWIQLKHAQKPNVFEINPEKGMTI